MVNRKQTILVVDDVASIRKLLCRVLVKEGYDCEEAGSASETLESLGKRSAELVLLDIKMPGKSGLDLLPEIKTEYPITSVIMATATDETDVVIECMKKGADDYVLKPFDLDTVLLSVQRTLEKRELQVKKREYQQHLEQEVIQQTKDHHKLLLGAVESLVLALEAKDKYTAGHSRRVSEIALAIGNELYLSSEELEDLRCGSLLHDVGKIAVDQLIQNKPGRLTDKEYEQMMIHGHLGADIVKSVVNDRVVEIIEHHHDHFDGNGHDQRVVGQKIPLGARILAIADAFDAMTSDRPYRPAMSLKGALDEIRRCAGTQFDPDLVRVLLKVISGQIPLKAVS